MKKATTKKKFQRIRNSTGTKQIKDLIWYTDFQTWKITENGLIYNSFFPKICLAVKQHVQVSLEINFKNEMHPLSLDGYLVSFGLRNSDDVEPDQQWSFNKLGAIVSEKKHNFIHMCLTSISVLQNEIELLKHKNSLITGHEFKVQSELNNYDLSDINLVVFQNLHVAREKNGEYPNYALQNVMDPYHLKVMKELGKSQRWAIKQETREALMNRDWKMSTLTTTK